jgi:hypothetical protein
VTSVAAFWREIPSTRGYDTFPLATGGNFLVEILPTLF